MKRLTHAWGVFGLRGLFAMLFGVVAFLSPTHTLRAMVLLFGCYALADGLFAIWTGLRASNRKEFMRASLVEGIIGLALGIGALAVPHVTELALVYMVATWAVITGALEIFAVDRSDHVTLNALPMGIFGLASMFAGALLFLNPKLGASILTLLLGGYSLIFGVILLHLAWRLYVHHQSGYNHADLHHANPTG